jgi:hypothetical protein
MPSTMPESHQIFKVLLNCYCSHTLHHLTRVTQATYSGIPVYELFVYQMPSLRVFAVSLSIQDVQRRRGHASTL